jgi:hypothetical protein
MAKVKLNLRGLTIPEKISRARQIVAAMGNNSNFDAPQPPLAQINSAISNLEVSYNAVQTARQEAKVQTATMGVREGELVRVMSQLAGYVEAVAGDNEEIVLSAGMDVRAPASATTAPPHAPADLTATAGDQEGEIDLTWDTVAGARSYVVERSPDPPTATSWTHAGVSPRSQTTINGLTPGTRCWFRVAAVNAAGQGPWSDPATKLVP